MAVNVGYLGCAVKQCKHGSTSAFPGARVIVSNRTSREQIGLLGGIQCPFQFIVCDQCEVSVMDGCTICGASTVDMCSRLGDYQICEICICALKSVSTNPDVQTWAGRPFNIREGAPGILQLELEKWMASDACRPLKLPVDSREVFRDVPMWLER